MTQSQLTALAVQMRQGDRNATEALYAGLNTKVYGFFFTRTGARKDIAEDLTQDIFVKLVQKIKSFDEKKGSFVIWFWQIARNMLVDHYRLKKTTTFSSYEYETLETMAIAPTPDFDDLLRHAKVKRAVNTMRKSERELFSLRYVNDLAYKDIGKILGKPEGVLRVAAWRIKEKVRQEVML